MPKTWCAAPWKNSHCDRLYRTSDWQELRKNSRSLIAIADQVGLQKMAAVANDVMSAVDQADPVAIAATLTRLIRVGERSLTAIWDVQDLSI
jgi:predicted pyridoxine 5'-phosphate oxidase superfamily flavin-nucleotide-binding protein